MRTASLAVAAAAAAVALAAADARANVIWRGDFETGDISQWSKAQMVSPDRLKVVSNPVAQGKYALQATVVAGDNPIGASGNRNELVYLSYEPSGTERYYRWQTMFANDYPSADTWQLFTQWHHSGDNGSPPVEFDIRNEGISLVVNFKAVWRAPLVRGVWHDFIFHVKWSNDPAVGFVELWYDGQLSLAKTFMTTQFAGMTQYLKQGLYRNSTIQPTGTVWHDGFVIGTTLDDVLGSAPASPSAGTPSTPDAGATTADAGHSGHSGATTQTDAGAGPNPDVALSDATGQQAPEAPQGSSAADGTPAVGCSASSGPAAASSTLAALGFWLGAVIVSQKRWRKERRRSRS